LKDEIKEILDKLSGEPLIDNCYFRLFKEDRDKLFDYITDLQKEKETFKSRLEKAIRIIDKFKETYIICFDKDLWGFVKRLEKCLTGSGKNEN